MDNLQWFKFSISNWVLGRIQKCPEVTQARFIRLVCLYWSKECNLSIEDAEIEIDKEHLDILFSKKVVKFSDDFICIDFLNEQFEDILKTSQKRREAVQNRWSKVKQNNTSVSINNTSVLQNDTDKSKIRKDTDIVDLGDKPPKLPKSNLESLNIRKDKFYKDVGVFAKDYSKELLRAFYDYWTEPNKSNSKMRWEMEKTFSLSLRLKNWSKNERNFGNKKTQNTGLGI